METFDTRLGRNYYFLSRASAISILEQLNLPYRDADGLSDVEERSEQADAVQLAREAGAQWTLEQARKLHGDYMASRAEDAAKKHGISVSRLYQILDDHDLPKKTRSRGKQATWCGL